MDDIKRFLKATIKRGFIVEHGSKHYKVYSEDRKRMMAVSATPSCRRALQNIEHQFRRVFGVSV